MKQIIDITPQKFLCEIATCCPAVFKVDDHTYHIIGRSIDISKTHLKGKVDSREMAIEIPAALLEEAIALVLQKKSFVEQHYVQ